jgi:HD-GYP domain-containing protein (c-di-GMP phosphodiesterase class II)
MDIEIIIRETAIFAGIFGFSIGLFMLAIIAGEQFLKPYIGDNRWIVPAFSLLLVTLVIRPVEKTIYNVAGRFLFRRKYEYQKTLQDAAEGMSKIRDPKKLLNLIVHIISAKLKLANAAVFLFDSRSSSYVLKASRGDIGDGLISLRSENALIMWLSEKKRPLALDDVLKWMNNFNQRRIPGSLKSDLFQIKDTMSTLHAALSVPCFFRDDLLGVLILGEKKNGDFFSQDDMDLFSALSNEAAIALKNSQLYFEIDRKAFELENLYKREHRLFMHSSVAFAAAIDARDPYTHGHSQRVTNISLVILDFMGAMDEIDKDAFFRHRLQITGVLHDIGKIGVPDDILHKPAQLTPEERKEIEKHPVLGAEIVSHIAGLKDLVGGIRYHHERYDGKGYPEGLKSDEIPLMARIISVADTYDAMTSDRPYRKGLPPLTARDEIQKNASAQFDPYVVAAFLKAFEQGKIE